MSVIASALPTNVTHDVDAVAGREPVVRVENLSVRFEGRGEGRPVVSAIDLTLHAGECVALVGESGSGKSVTARSLVGLNGAKAVWQADRFEIGGAGMHVASASATGVPFAAVCSSMNF